MSNNVAEASILSTIVIDPEGDVYLELEKAAFRVSSKVLATASKVFNDMFKTDFQEGLDLAKDETCRIPLPDDDTATMHVLCLRLHHQDIPASVATITSALLRDVALLATKYACTYAIKIWVDDWIGDLLAVRRDETVPQTAKHIDLLLAAYTFDCAARFRDVTKRMVYGTEGGNSLYRWTYIHRAILDTLPGGLLGKFRNLLSNNIRNHFPSMDF